MYEMMALKNKIVRTIHENTPHSMETVHSCLYNSCDGSIDTLLAGVELASLSMIPIRRACAEIKRKGVG